MSVWSCWTLQLCILQGRIAASTEVKKQQRWLTGWLLVLEDSEKVKVMSFYFYSGQTFQDNHLLVSLISIQVHFSLDYFNNFVVTATVIWIHSISDLCLWEVNTHCFPFFSSESTDDVGGGEANSSVLLSGYLDFWAWFFYFSVEYGEWYLTTVIKMLQANRLLNGSSIEHWQYNPHQ